MFGIVIAMLVGFTVGYRSTKSGSVDALVARLSRKVKSENQKTVKADDVPGGPGEAGSAQ